LNVIFNAQLPGLFRDSTRSTSIKQPCEKPKGTRNKFEQNDQPPGTLNFMPEHFGDGHETRPNFAIKNDERAYSNFL